MKKNFTKKLAMAICFCLLAGVTCMADSFTLYSDRDEYMGNVLAADWEFGSFNKTGNNNKTPIKWDFEINWLNSENDPGNGELIMSLFNGNGGLMQSPTVTDGVLSFHHNSANKLDMSFDADFIDTFYLEFDPHSSWSADTSFIVAMSYWYNGEIFSSNNIATLDKNGSFFGIAFEDGAYLTEISFTATGTKNNGYKVTAGFGGEAEDEELEFLDGPSEVPEPGTFLLLGTGIIGLGIAAKRKLTQK